MRADKTTVAHVHQRTLDRGDTTAPRHREHALVRRPVAGLEHGLGLIDRDKQQLVLVRHDHVAFQYVTELARLQRAGSDFGHGRSGKAFGQEGQQVLASGGRRVLGGAPGDVSQTAGTGYQADTDFDQPDVTFHGDNAFG